MVKASIMGLVGSARRYAVLFAIMCVAVCGFAQTGPTDIDVDWTVYGQKYVTQLGSAMTDMLPYAAVVACAFLIWRVGKRLVH